MSIDSYYDRKSHIFSGFLLFIVGGVGSISNNSMMLS